MYEMSVKDGQPTNVNLTPETKYLFFQSIIQIKSYYESDTNEQNYFQGAACF